MVRSVRLTGGITSTVHAVTIESRDGRRRRLVLRRWTDRPTGSDTGDDPVDAVRREAVVLDAIANVDLPAPRLVAADPEGRRAGCPALLMTRLPGRIDLTPRDPDAWLHRVAELLPTLHAVTPAAVLPSYTSWLELDDIDVPSWSRRPQLWRAAIDIARAAPPVTAGGFVHHDYQPFNLLWRPDGRLCGLVDWVWASQGPPDDDVAHCRLNLCLLYSAERAEQFRQRYERAAGRAMDTWWAVASLVDYLGGWTAEGLQEQAGRRLRVDAAGIDARVEELLAMTLRAAG